MRLLFGQVPCGPHIANAKEGHAITGFPYAISRPASDEGHYVVVPKPFIPSAISVVDGVGHRNLQVRFGATLDSYARVKAKKIGNPQPLDLRRPNLVAGRVTLKLDDSESALPQNRCNSSRANSTDADVPQKLPVALESHNCRFQWLAALGHQVRHRNAQGDGQLLDIQQRDVAFAALDTANVGPMKAGKVAQCFLRNPLLSADFAESFPKSNLYVGQDRTLCCINRLGCL